LHKTVRNDMSLTFYNTLTRKKEIFKPVASGKVSMYNCGPTVYNYAHIGNFRAYVFEDILKRYLKFKGYDVTQVMNLTDVDDRSSKNAPKPERRSPNIRILTKRLFSATLKR